jgi:hypothetical protein
MIRAVEIIIIIALLIFSFFMGVIYSASVKSHLSWINIKEEQEIEIPDMPNDGQESEIPYSSEDEGDAGSAPTQVNSPEVQITAPEATQDVPAVNESESEAKKQ